MAAAETGVSYRKAWNSIEETEKAIGFKLVERQGISLDVTQICDSDLQKAGSTAWGYPVVAPTELVDTPQTVVISSFAFAGVIFDTLCGLGVPESSIVNLYASQR